MKYILTPEQIDEAIAVMAAARNGSKIDGRVRNSGHPWTPITRPDWNWSDFEFRVRSEKFTGWVNFYPDRTSQTLHFSEEEALRAKAYGCTRTIPVREISRDEL